MLALLYRGVIGFNSRTEPPLEEEKWRSSPPVSARSHTSRQLVDGGQHQRCAPWLVTIRKEASLAFVTADAPTTE